MPSPAAFREAPPAPLQIRFRAAALDALLVLGGTACAFAAARAFSAPVPTTPRAALPWIALALLLALFYHLLWCVLGTESPGMRYFRLRLVNFDGHEAEPAQRKLRLLFGVLGLTAGGLGLLWALFDEEALAWHDHVSKTFPTVDETPRARTRRA